MSAAAGSQPLICPSCGGENPPGTPFCGMCGKFLLNSANVAPAVGTGSQYPRASHSHIASVIPYKSHAGIWSSLILLIILAMTVLGVTANSIASSASTCTGGCPPPSQSPLQAPHQYTSAQYGFSLEYFDRNDVTLETTSQDDSSIGFDVKENPVYSWSFTGSDATGQDAQQIVKAAHDADFPDATLVYTIPQAEIGYTAGYGNVYDDTVFPDTGDAVHARIFIESAVKNNVAVTVEAVGEYKNIDYGHPNPSQSPAPVLFDPMLSTVTWKNQPPL